MATTPKTLKTSVVIKNEFTVKSADGRGSRGATPGDYVLRYMARKGATEPLAPIVRTRTDDFIMRYMARESAVERPDTTLDEVSQATKRPQGSGGIAFGYESVSLSHEQLQAASADIQRLFDSGKTVMKTVLSFDEEYLRRHKIIPADFHATKRGDYRGHIDQMRLRMAIMHGLDRMAKGREGFDDLRYVGVIQVDTLHVHAHLAMVDAGKGILPRGKDGRVIRGAGQRGKLGDGHKSRLRRGVDAWLDMNHHVAHLASAVGYERRNVTGYIKRWAFETIRSESLPQFLLACLPEDRRLWRAGSNDKRMRKANQVARELVEEQLQHPGSPLPEAMEAVMAYANRRRDNEGLSTTQWRRLVDEGRSLIVERAVNAVWQTLRALPAEVLRVRTPMLDLMGMDLGETARLAAQAASRPDGPGKDLVTFGFRLRSYSSRLRYHRDQASNQRDMAQQWERLDQAGVAVPASRALYDFYQFETWWNECLSDKYRHFLPLLDDGSAWADQINELEGYGRSLVALEALRADHSLRMMKDFDQAERLGRDVYGQSGGGLLSTPHGWTALDARVSAMRRIYDERLVGLRDGLAGAGLVASGADGDDPVPGTAITVVQGARNDFSEVKGLDLHHLAYDFAHDTPVGLVTGERFLEAARGRHRLLTHAIEYLEKSGQPGSIPLLPVGDVARMMAAAGELEATRTSEGFILRSRLAELRTEQMKSGGRRSAAPVLSHGLAGQVRAEVDKAARAFLTDAPATQGAEETYER